MARPCHDAFNNNGKIVIWHFAQQVAARNNSINRPSVTWEWKTHPVDTKCYVYVQVLAAIVDKCLDTMKATTIQIQQDNTPLYMKINDPAFLEAD